MPFIIKEKDWRFEKAINQYVSKQVVRHSQKIRMTMTGMVGLLSSSGDRLLIPVTAQNYADSYRDAFDDSIHIDTRVNAYLVDTKKDRLFLVKNSQKNIATLFDNIYKQHTMSINEQLMWVAKTDYLIEENEQKNKEGRLILPMRFFPTIVADADVIDSFYMEQDTGYIHYYVAKTKDKLLFFARTSASKDAPSASDDSFCEFVRSCDNKEQLRGLFKKMKLPNILMKKVLVNI